MAELYEPYTPDLATGTESGFKNNAWIALVSWFDTEAVPAPGMTPVMGDNYTIATAHTFIADTGALPIYCFPKTGEQAGEASGDQGAKTLSFKPKIFIAGDNAPSLELVQNILNKPFVMWLERTGCPGQLIQYGCTCTPTYIDTVSAVTPVVLSGKSGYEITVEALAKYFYNAALAEYPA